MACGMPGQRRMNATRQQEDIPADPAALIRLGTIAAVDLQAARCTVLYGDPDDEDGGAVSPPVRWLAPRAGDTGVWSPPSVGEQVVLLSPDGQIGAAIALTGIVHDRFPPVGNDLIETIVFGDGARLSYDPQGHALSVVLPAGRTIDLQSPGEITIDAPAGVTIRGNLRLDGTLELSGDVLAQGDVQAGNVSLRDHRHLGVSTGSQQSGPPA